MAVALEIFVERMPPQGWGADERDEHFSSLYARCYEPLVDYCAKLLHDRTAAADVAQEALVKAWEAFDRYSTSRPFWPWVVTVARRLCIDEFRRADRTAARVPALAGLVEDRWQSPEDAVELDEESRLARVALKSLNPGFQRVVMLREIDGWSYEQIATFERTTVASIRCRLNRARTALRESYQRVAGSLAGFLGIGHASRARRRLHGLQASGAPLTPMGAERLADAATLLLVAAMAVVPAAEGLKVTPTPERPRQSAAAGAAPADDPAPLAASASPGANTRASSPLGLTALVPGRSAQTVEQSEFVSFTPSPQYASDGTVFAVGKPRAGCGVGGTCESLFRSTDRGSTWHRIDEAGFGGSRVLLSPAYPADSRIFVESSVALLVSNDGGRTFVPSTPSGGSVAMTPNFGRDQRILVGGSAPGWDYDGGTGDVRPVVLTPPPVGTQLSFGFAPDGRVLVGSNVGTITACDGAICGAPTPVSELKGTPRFASGEAGVFAWFGRSLVRSVDGGATFVPVGAASAGLVTDVVSLGPEHFVVASVEADGGLHETIDGGRTWRRLGADTALAAGARAVTNLGAGTLIAAPSGGTGGMLCSADGGATWSSRCSKGPA